MIRFVVTLYTGAFAAFFLVAAANKPEGGTNWLAWGMMFALPPLYFAIALAWGWIKP